MESSNNRSSQTANEQLVNDLILKSNSAWNSHDVDAFAALFKADGDFVNVLGQKASGRDEIREMHRYPFSSVQAAAKVAIERIELRELTPNYIYADYWWKAVGSKNQAGEILPDRFGILCFVVEIMEGHAEFISGRNMDFTNRYTQDRDGPPRKA